MIQVQMGRKYRTIGLRSIGAVTGGVKIVFNGVGGWSMVNVNMVVVVVVGMGARGKKKREKTEYMSFSNQKITITIKNKNIFSK